MRWLLNYIRQHPEGTPKNKLVAIASLNLGLNPKTTLEYLQQFLVLNLIDIRLETVYPVLEEESKDGQGIRKED
jgi:hypothetical protein